MLYKAYNKKTGKMIGDKVYRDKFEALVAAQYALVKQYSIIELVSYAGYKEAK